MYLLIYLYISKNVYIVLKDMYKYKYLHTKNICINMATFI